MTTKQLLNKISQLRSSISPEVGSSTMDMIDELVKLEFQRACNDSHEVISEKDIQRDENGDEVEL